MATIPKVQTSTRRIGILPQIQSHKSKWGEVGREVKSVLSAGERTLDAYDHLKDTELRVDYHKRERAKAEAERAEAEAERARQIAERAKHLEEQKIAAEERRIDREGQYGAAKFDSFVQQAWNGSAKVNADGTTTEIPGIISKHWTEMDREKKTAFDYLGDILTKAKEQDFYAKASPEVRAAIDKHMQFKIAQYGQSAYKLHTLTNGVRMKEENAAIEAKINEELQSVEHADETIFAAESNYAALRKLTQKYGSAIENPDILLQPVVKDGKVVRTVQIGDLKLKGVSDRKDPAYARLQADYEALITEHAKNRITNLTRFASIDTPIGGVSGEEMLSQAEKTRQSLRVMGLSSEKQDAALGALIGEAKEKMLHVREKAQTENASKLDDGYTELQYKLAPTTDANGSFDPSKAMEAKFDDVAEKKKLDALVAEKKITPVHAATLFARYQKMHQWQIELSERIKQANADKLAVQSGEKRNFAPQSDATTYVELKKRIADMSRSGVNPDIVIKEIEDAVDRGKLSSTHYFSLWQDVRGKRDEQKDRIVTMVFTEFYNIGEGTLRDAVDPSKRGTPSGDKAVEALLDSDNAEYFTSSTWFHDPDFTVEDVDASYAAVRDYIEAHPGDYVGAKKLMLDLVKPFSDAARARTLRERIIKMRESKSWDVNAAFRKEDEANAPKNLKSKGNASKVSESQSRMFLYGGGLR